MTTKETAAGPIIEPDRTRRQRAARALLKNEDHRILQGEQLLLRDRLIREGKKTKAPELWVALDWFDRVAELPHRLALVAAPKEKAPYAAPTEDY